MFDSFYFLHIPKTAGRLFMYNTVLPLIPMMKRHNIKILDEQINGGAHNQWRNDITNTTYVSCIFRDPAEQLVSLYVHTLSAGGHSQKEELQKDVSKDVFLDWVQKNIKLVSNFQSKQIVAPTLEMVGDNKFFGLDENFNINKIMILDKISKISLFLKPEILTYNRNIILQQKILSDFQIPLFEVLQNTWQQELYSNAQSKKLYVQLTNTEIEYLKTISSIDSEIYETDGLFFKI
jgi:hypothetical protein